MISLYFFDKLGGIVERRVCSASRSVVVRDNRDALIPITIHNSTGKNQAPKPNAVAVDVPS